MKRHMYIFLMLIPIVFIVSSCDDKTKVNTTNIEIVPNPVTAVISSAVDRRWYFNVKITNKTDELLIIDGYSSERQGENRNHESITRRADTAEFSAFGQGSKWEYKGEKIPAEGFYEIRGAVFENAVSGIQKGTEIRSYRFRKNSGELLVVNTTIKLLPESN